MLLPDGGLAAADPRALLHRRHPGPGAGARGRVPRRRCARRSRPRPSAPPGCGSGSRTAHDRWNRLLERRPARVGEPCWSVSMPFLLRVELPDVPGSLGRLASAIGEAGGDIEAIEIVEKRPTAPPSTTCCSRSRAGTMPDSIVSACNALDGVQVLWISRYAAGGNLFLDLEAVEDLTADPAARPGPAGRPAARSRSAPTGARGCTDAAGSCSTAPRPPRPTSRELALIRHRPAATPTTTSTCSARPGSTTARSW